MADQSNVASFMAKQHPPNGTSSSNPIVGSMIGSQSTSKPWPSANFPKEVHAAAVAAGTKFKGR